MKLNLKDMLYIYKVQFSRYRPGVAQRVGRGIALPFNDHGTRRGWVVSSMSRPHFTPGKDPVPILQEAGWAPGPVWTGGKSRPHRDSIPDRPARSSATIPTELPDPHKHTHTHTCMTKTLSCYGGWCWHNPPRGLVVIIWNRSPNFYYFMTT